MGRGKHYSGFTNRVLMSVTVFNIASEDIENYTVSIFSIASEDIVFVDIAGFSILSEDREFRIKHFKILSQDIEQVAHTLYYKQ